MKKHWLIALLGFSPLPCATSSAEADPRWKAFVADLVASSRKASDDKNLRVLRPHIADNLMQWYVPGSIFIPYASYTRDRISGYGPATDSTQDAKLLLTMAFDDLRTAPVVVLRDTKFDPYAPRDCRKRPEWTERWVVYPGDYLLDQRKRFSPDPVCPVERRAGTLSASGPNDVELAVYCREKIQATLLYFNGGENHYFGLVQVQGRWKIRSVAIDNDCVA